MATESGDKKLLVNFPKLIVKFPPPRITIRQM
jgi:hypothetical protein